MARTVYVPEARRALNFPDGTTDQQILSYVRTKYAPDPPPPAPPQEDIGAFRSGIASYLGQTEYGVGRVAQAAGLEGLSKYLYEQAKQNEEYAAKHKPAVSDVTQIGGVGDAASWAGDTFLQTLPNFAGGYAGTIAGSAIGSVVPGIGTAIGGAVGFALSQLPAFIGGNMQEQMQQNGVSPEQTSFLPATGGAAAQTTVDYVADKLIFRGLPVTKTVGQLAKRAFTKEVLKIASSQSLSEGAQQAIQIAQANPDRLAEFGPEVQTEILNAAAAGLALGGGLGAISTGIGKLTEEPPPKPTREIEQDIRAGGVRGQQLKRNGEINLGVQALSKLPVIGNLKITPVQSKAGPRFALQNAQGTTISEFSDPVLATTAVDRYKKLSGKDIKVQSAVSAAEVPTTTAPEITTPAPATVSGPEPVVAPETPDTSATPAPEIVSVEPLVNKEALTEPPVPDGMVRVYHSGAAGDGADGRWVSTNKQYASDYRRDLPLYYTDIPATDKRVSPDEFNPEQTVAAGYTYNFELKPEEAAQLTEIQRDAPVEAAPAEAPVAPIAEAPAPEAAPAPSMPVEDVTPDQLAEVTQQLPANDEVAIDTAAQEEARKRLAESNARVAESLSSQIKQYGLKDVEVNFIPAFVNELGRPTTQKGSESIKDGKSIIKISMAVFDADLSVEQMVTRAVEILNHEAIHSLSDLGLLRKSEMKMLFEAAAKTKVPGKNYTYLDYAKRVYEPLAKTNPVYQNPEAIAEEGVAEMFRDWRKGNKNVPSGVRGIINRVFDILRRMFGAMKKRSHEDIFGEIAAGKVGTRKRAAKVIGETGPKASVDPDNPEFRRWFRESKVVDESGKPLTLYHGTADVMDEFKHDQPGKKDKGWLGRGFYFTNSPILAKEYAMLKAGNDENIIPVHLSIQNPYNASLEEKQMLRRALEEGDTLAPQRFSDDLKAQGYDGVILDFGRPDGLKEFVAFEPVQIKSIFNNFEPGTAKSEKLDLEPDVPMNGPAPNYPFGRRVPEVTAADTDAVLGRVEYGAIVNGIERLFNSRRGKALTFFLPDRFRPDKAAITSFIQNFADKIMPLGQLVDYVRQHGGTVPDALDPYMQAQLAQSSVSNELEWREENLYKPVLDAMQAYGISDVEIENYLYALHAPERNAWIRSINPGADPELGSGMSDEEAAAIVDRVNNDPRRAQFEAVEQLVRNIIDDTNRHRVESGLTPDFDNLPTVDEEGNPVPAPNFQKYVPLRGYADESATEGDVPEEMRARIGRGFKIRGREDMRAYGRSSRASDIIAHTMLQNSEALIRAAKNRVNLSLLGLIENNPQLAAQFGISVMGQKPLRKYISSKGVVKTMVDPMYKNRDDVLLAKREGKEIAIQIDNKFLQKALISAKSGDPEFTNKVSGFLQRMNRILAGVNTVYNPEFMLVNFPRDLQQAAINITQFDLPGIRRKIIKDALPAVKGVFSILRNPDAQNEWSQWYNDFRADGGNTSGFWGAFTLEDRLKEIEKMTNDLGAGGPHRAKKAWNWITGLLEDSNGAFENAVRLSVYKNVIEAGVSRQRAAMIAKNLTINFDQRGVYGPALNSLYLFYNASVQGTFALGTAIARSKKVRRLLAGIVVMGIVQDQLNAMMSDGDDEDKLYDKIPDYVLEGNLVIMDPFGYTDKGYFKIPLPYGANAFYNFGRALSRNFRGKYTTGEAISSIGWTAVDAFNPIGGTESFINFMAPTAIDPLVSIALNNDFSGKRIYPESFPGAIPKSDSNTFFSSTSPTLTSVTKYINSITGGTEYVPGLIDLSPDVLEYVLDYFTGSAGAFVRRTIDTGTNTIPALLTGDLENVEVNSIPFARKLFGNVSERVTYEDYFDKVSHVLARGAEWQSALKEGDPQRIKSVKARFADEIAIFPAVRALANRRNQLASEMRKIKENTKIPPEQKRRRIQAIQKQIDVIVARVNKLYGQKIGSKYPGLF